ncbi:MAG: hypothetical protein IKK44_01655 [Clostridium sp.]|nr:hypothetical protein [Clostridium sp.]
MESVDPLILGMKLVDVCDCRPSEGSIAEIPSAILDSFQEELVLNGDIRRLYVTLGQFSIIRLERETQMLMPIYDYCIPDKECACEEGDCGEQDPCEVFRQVQFPLDAFFPPNGCSTGSC